MFPDRDERYLVAYQRELPGTENFWRVSRDWALTRRRWADPATQKQRSHQIWEPSSPGLFPVRPPELCSYRSGLSAAGHQHEPSGRRNVSHWLWLRLLLQRWIWWERGLRLNLNCEISPASSALWTRLKRVFTEEVQIQISFSFRGLKNNLEICSDWLISWRYLRKLTF